MRYLSETENNKVFTFQFVNDKIDQSTNFAELPSAKWLFFGIAQSYIYQVLQTIQMKLILLCAVLGSAKTALKFIYKI